MNMRFRILTILSLLTVLPAWAADSLPKVALIGDSIRLSYAPTVIARLKGQTVIVSPKANGGDSANVLKNLERWVINERPDVVHFNCGIHDTKFYAAKKQFQVSPKQYEANLRAIVDRIRKATKAAVLFATTTPILDDRALASRKNRRYTLTAEAVERYNAIARRVMLELKVPVNDLHATINQGESASLIGADGVHLTGEARALLGRQVAGFVRKHIEKQ